MKTDRETNWLLRYFDWGCANSMPWWRVGGINLLKGTGLGLLVGLGFVPFVSLPTAFTAMLMMASATVFVGFGATYD